MPNERTTDAAKAAKAEVDKKPITIEYEDVTYELKKRSAAFYEAGSDNNGIGMLRALLGPLQWTQFMAKYADGDDFLTALAGLLDAFGKAIGSGNR